MAVWRLPQGKRFKQMDADDEYDEGNAQANGFKPIAPAAQPAA